MAFKIEKNKKRPEALKFPFLNLAINESFFIELKNTKEAKHLQNALHCVNFALTQKFTSRSVKEKGISGRRIWRTE